MKDDTKANELYVAAIKAGTRNLPEPFYWKNAEMGPRLHQSWEMFCKEAPETKTSTKPFDVYMNYMHANYRG